MKEIQLSFKCYQLTFFEEESPNEKRTVTVGASGPISAVNTAFDYLQAQGFPVCDLHRLDFKGALDVVE